MVFVARANQKLQCELAIDIQKVSYTACLPFIEHLNNKKEKNAIWIQVPDQLKKNFLEETELKCCHFVFCCSY
jgi:hypothetical protein